MTIQTDPALSVAFDANALAALEAQRDEIQTQIADYREDLSGQAAGEGFDRDDFAIKTQRFNANRTQLEIVNRQIEAMNLSNPTVVELNTDPNTAPDSRLLLATYLRAEDAADVLRSDDFSEVRNEGKFRIGLAPADAIMERQGAITSDTSSAENAVNEPTLPMLVERLKYAGSVGKLFQQMSTATGGDISIPRIDNVADEGEVVGAQDSAINSADPADIGEAVLKEDLVSSKFIKMDNRAVRDVAFDVVTWAENTVARRIGRTMNKVMTNGSSGRNFQGVKAVAKDGVSTADRNTLTWKNIVSAKFSIDEAYRAGNEGFDEGFMDFQKGMGAVGWMFHVDVVEHLHGLVDNDGRPLWAPNTREGMPDMLAGYPMFVNNDLDAFGANAVVGLFGNFGHMVKRDIGGLDIYNFQDSNTMEKNQTWVLGLWGCNSTLVGPESASGVADAIAKIELGA